MGCWVGKRNIGATGRPRLERVWPLGIMGAFLFISKACQGESQLTILTMSVPSLGASCGSSVNEMTQ